MIAIAKFAASFPVLVRAIERDPEHHLLSEPMAPTVKTRLMSQLEPPTRQKALLRMSHMQIDKYSYLVVSCMQVHSVARARARQYVRGLPSFGLGAARKGMRAALICAWCHLCMVG